MNSKTLLILMISMLLMACSSTAEIEYVYKAEKINYEKRIPSKIFLEDFKYKVLTSENIEEINNDVENGNNYYILFDYEEYKKAANREAKLKQAIKELKSINKYYEEVLDGHNNNQ